MRKIVWWFILVVVLLVAALVLWPKKDSPAPANIATDTQRTPSGEDNDIAVWTETDTPQARVYNPEVTDTDGDGSMDATDEDIDGDEIPNTEDDDIDGDEIINTEDSAPNDAQNLAEKNSDEPSAQADPIDEIVAQNSAWFITFTPSTLQTSLRAGEKIALFFHAGRSPSCRLLEKDIQNNLDMVPPGTTIYKVDYDAADELKEKYGITSPHTIVYIDDNGEAEKISKGIPTLNDLLANF